MATTTDGEMTGITNRPATLLKDLDSNFLVTTRVTIVRKMLEHMTEKSTRATPKELKNATAEKAALPGSRLGKRTAMTKESTKDKLPNPAIAYVMVALSTPFLNP